tara:strand:- start:32 stop:520 length:489 start_codon:yes stop_codon:yes gene_type:complete
MYVFGNYAKDSFAFLNNKDNSTANEFIRTIITPEDKKLFGWTEDIGLEDPWDYLYNYYGSLGETSVTIDLIKKFANYLHVDEDIIEISFFNEDSDYREMIVDWEVDKSVLDYQNELEEFNSRFDDYETALKDWEFCMEVYTQEKKEYDLYMLELKKKAILSG